MYHIVTYITVSIFFVLTLLDGIEILTVRRDINIW